LLDGSLGAINFQVGSNSQQLISTAITSYKTRDMGGHSYELKVNSRVPRVLTNYTDVKGLGGISFTTPATDNLTALPNLELTIDDINLTLPSSGSAKGVADKLQTSNIPAIAETRVVLNMFEHPNEASSYEFNPAATFSFDLRGKNTLPEDPVAISAIISSSEELQDIVDVVNDNYKTTGIEAELTPDGRIALVNLEGENIEIENTDVDFATGDDIHVTAAVYPVSDTTYDPKNAITDMTDYPALFNESDVFNPSRPATFTGSVKVYSEQSFTIESNEQGLIQQETSKQISDFDDIASIDVKTTLASQESLFAIDGALKTIDTQRAKLGAIQNRLGSSIDNLDNAIENISHSRGRILDTDFAQQTSELTRQQIIQNASTSLTAQANNISEIALALLG